MVGLISAITACTVFAVALVLALLCEFIVTGGIGETVNDSFVSTGGRICGATSLLAFVVAFGVAAWRAGREARPLTPDQVRRVLDRRLRSGLRQCLEEEDAEQKGTS